MKVNRTLVATTLPLSMFESRKSSCFLGSIGERRGRPGGCNVPAVAVANDPHDCYALD